MGALMRSDESDRATIPSFSSSSSALVAATSTHYLSKNWRVLRSHIDSYTGGHVALSHDEKWLACWCSQAIKLLDIVSGSVLREFSDNADAFLCFALGYALVSSDVNDDDDDDDDEDDDKKTNESMTSNGEQLLATAQRSGLIRIWRTTTGECISEWRAHDLPISCMCFNSSASLLASGSVDRSVLVWNVRKGFCTHNFASSHQDLVTALTFHPTDERLILYSASRDGGIMSSDLRTKSQHALSNHLSAVTAMTIDVKTDRLVTVSRDQVINVWNANNNTLIRTIAALEPLESLCIIDACTARNVCLAGYSHHSNASVFVTVGERGQTRFWDISSFECLFTDTNTTVSSGGSAESLIDVVWMRSCARFVLVSADHNLSVRNASTFAEHKLIVGYNDEILDVRCVPGTRCAVVATNSEHIRLMNLDTFDAKLLRGHTDIVVCVCVSHDGAYVATASKDNTVRVFELSSFKLVATGEGHTASVSAVAVSPTKSADIASCADDRTLKLWHFDATKSSLHVTASVVAHDKDINGVAFAPNGKIIATGSHDKSIKVWNIGSTSLKLNGTLNGHRRGVWSVAFSPTERCLASCSGDRTVRLWSLTDMSCVRTLDGHTAAVLRVHFTRNGLQLFSAGADALVKLWTLRTSECVATFESQHDDRIWALDIANDIDSLQPSTLVTGGADSRLNVWRDVTAEEERVQNEKKDAQVLLDQSLRDAMRVNDHVLAAQIALRTESSRKLFSVLEAMMRQGNKNNIIDDDDDDDIIVFVKSLDSSALQRCLGYLLNWNTVSGYAPLAQRLLKTILSFVERQTLLRIPNFSATLDALLAYSTRHFERVERLLRKSFLLDYALNRLGDIDNVDEQQNVASGVRDVETTVSQIAVASQSKRKSAKRAEKDNLAQAMSRKVAKTAIS